MLTLLAAIANAGPLAIPFGGVPATPTDPAALQAYAERSVSIRRQQLVRLQPTHSVGFGMGVGVGLGAGAGFGAGGFNTFTPPPTPTTFTRWSVLQRDDVLSVPDWLELGGTEEDRRDLRRRLRTTSVWQGVLAGTAVAGGAALVGSSYASQSGSAPGFDDWQLAASVGTVALVGGLMGAWLTGHHKHRLRHDYSTSQDPVYTEDQVRAYNAALRQELGLSREETSGPN